MINTILLKTQTIFAVAIGVNNNPFGLFKNVADSYKIK